MGRVRYALPSLYFCNILHRYYKYLRPSTRLTEERQRLFSQSILKRSMSMGNLAAMADLASEEEDGGDAVTDGGGLLRRKAAVQASA